MFPIIVSHENWHVGKASLHAALPMVRSSHLAEAIAAGLGARQHASIVPKLQPEERGHDAIVLGQDEKFVERLFELGYDDIAAGHFEAAFRGPALPHSIYTVFNQGDRARNDSHHRQCSRHGRPMMMVKLARAYAELEWDCITVNPDEDGYLHDEAGDQLAKIMFNLFQARAKGAPGSPLFVGSAFTGTIKKLLPATARQLAEDYFRLLYLPLIEPKSALATS